MIWLTRGKKPLLNRKTGQTAVGNYSARVEGPDGITDSGLYFDGMKNLVLPLKTVIDGDFTFQLGLKLSIRSIAFTKTGSGDTTILGYKPTAPELGKVRVRAAVSRNASIYKNGLQVAGSAALGGSIDFYQTYFRHASACDLGTQASLLTALGYEYHGYGLNEANYTPVLSWTLADGFVLTIPAAQHNASLHLWTEGGDSYVFGFTDILLGWTVDVIK
jgi:hypothetical protein